MTIVSAKCTISERISTEAGIYARKSLIEIVKSIYKKVVRMCGKESGEKALGVQVSIHAENIVTMLRDARRKEGQE